MSSSDKVWTVDTQVSFLHALQDHKPVGIKRHFEIVLIEEKLNKNTNNKINYENIWSYLNTYYNLNALNESERGEKLEEKNFELPSEFNDLMNKPYPRVTRSSTLPKATTSFNKTTKPSHKTHSTKSQISSSSSSSSLFEKNVDSKVEEREASPKQEEKISEKNSVTSNFPGKSGTSACRPEGQKEGRSEGGEGRKRTRQSFQHTLNNSHHYTSSSSTSKRNRRI